MATSKVDFQIGPRTPTRYATFTDTSPTWGSAVARMANSWATGHAKRKTAEADRAMQTEQARKRGAWAQAIGEGATVRDIAQRDPSIIGDSSFLKFLSDTKAPDRFEDVLDDQGRPIAQRGPQGRTFAHPLAPEAEAEGPEPERFEDILDPFGHGGFGQRSSTTGKIIGYRAAPTQPQEAPPPPPETPFSDKSADERFMNILAQGDPSSPRYAAAWNRLAQPRVTFDPASGQQISVSPDMSAFRRPGAQGAPAPDTMQARGGQGGPAGPGPTAPDTGGVTRAQTGAPRFNEMQARAAQAADEMDAAIGILEAPGEDGRPLFNQGTNPVDALNPTSFFKGQDRERYEQSLLGAVQMILRMETGAEAPAHEVKGTMARYAPRPGDEPETIEQKMVALKRRARSAAEIAGQPYEAVKSRRGEPQAAPQPQGLPQALPQAAPQPPAQAPQAQSFEALAKALAGPQRSQAAPPPRAPAPAAASIMGSARASSLPQQRIQDYATLPPDALKRQAAKMAEKLAANPEAYPQAEIDALKIAYDRAFPGR